MLPNGLLWKYLGLDDNQQPRLAFLDDCLFRITQPRALNDPFEVKPRILLDQYSEEDRIVARQEALASGVFPGGLPSGDEIERLFLASGPGRRFDEKDFPGLYPARIPGLREEPFNSIAEIDEFRARRVKDTVEAIINETIGVFSMTEDPAQLVMWSQYAAEHRGVCVGFDKRHPFFLQAGELRQVEYLNRRVSISSNGGLVRIAGHELTKALPMDTLLRKHPDWEHEREWRLIALLQCAAKVNLPWTGRDPIYLFRFLEATIQTLILGVRVRPEQVSEIRARLQEARWRHVRLYQARLSEEQFALEFGELQAD